MPRGTDPALLEALAANVTRPAIFVKIGFREVVSRWTGTAPIEFGGTIYQPARGALEVGEIAEALDGAQPQTTVSLSDFTFDQAQRPLLEGQVAKIEFQYTGADQNWTAPFDGFIIPHAIGAGGGPDVFEGGTGGYTRTKIRVSAGDVFTIVIGQGGINLTTVYGFGGTGQGAAHQHNGGGGTFFLRGATAALVTDFNRVVVAAGGGGAGGSNGENPGGRSGGNAHDYDAGGMPTFQGTPATGGDGYGIGGGGGGWRGGGTKAGQNFYGLGGTGYAVTELESPIVAGTPWPGGNPPVPANIWDGIAGKSGEHGMLVLEYESPELSTPYDPPASIYFGATDDELGLIGDPQLVFSGTVDRMRVVPGPEGRLAEIGLIGAEPIVEAHTGEKYTDANQKKKFPGDKGLEYVAAIDGQTLTWGGTNV